jgi:hypothetical protein
MKSPARGFSCRGSTLKIAIMKEDKKENQGNMAPGQQNAPEPGKVHYSPAEKTGEEILNGARNQDQLEQFKANTDGNNQPEDAQQSE